MSGVFWASVLGKLKRMRVQLVTKGNCSQAQSRHLKISIASYDIKYTVVGVASFATGKSSNTGLYMNR